MIRYSHCVAPLMFVTSSEALTLSNLMGAILTPPVFGLDGDVPTSVFAAHMHSPARLVPLAGPHGLLRWCRYQARPPCPRTTSSSLGPWNGEYEKGTYHRDAHIKSALFK